LVGVKEAAMSDVDGRAVIEVRDLVKIYGADTKAVDGITFSVASGELFGFLATLLRATSGTARVPGFGFSPAGELKIR
jgi:ABC-type multidrug transport system ATPase subunit